MKKKLLLTCSLVLLLNFPVQASDNLTPIPNSKSAAGRILKAKQHHQLTFSEIGNKYINFKDFLEKKYGLNYSLTTSFMPQYGSPSGKSTAFQTIVYPAITW